MLEVNLLKVARTLRQDSTPEKYNTARLEESLLTEYSSAVQRNRYHVSHSTKTSDSYTMHTLHEQSRHSLSRIRSDTDVVKRIYSAIHRWDVDPFETQDSDLMLYIEQMLVSFEIIDTYKISLPKLRSFIMAVHATYPEQTINPFHNFRHGWSVMHMTYQILRHGAAQYLTRLEIFSALIGSLCHDLDHPGHSNAFEVASYGELSYLYGDDAVLERHHTAETFRLLRMPENDILEHLTHDQKLEMRRLLNSGIMATDMAQHFGHVEQLVARGKKSPHVDHDEPTERRSFLGNILHCADLSGQALPYHIAIKWSEGCLSEFRNQARKEAELGLPLTPFMQGLDKEITCMQLQFGFVANIVIPLWTALAQIIPETRVMVDQARAMKEFYNSRINALSEGQQISISSGNTSAATQISSTSTPVCSTVHMNDSTHENANSNPASKE